MKLLTLTAAGTLALALAACSTPGMMNTMKTPDAPAAVTVPAGHKVVMMTTGVGDLTYECRVKAGAANAWEWVFAGPDAVLYDMNKKMVGKYYGGPTWEARDGSKVVGSRVNGKTVDPTAIPWLLLKATPSSGADGDRFAATTFIQRINTVAGLPPAAAECNAGTVGSTREQPYETDYVFWKQTGA